MSDNPIGGTAVDSARDTLEEIVRRLEPMEREFSFPMGYFVGDKTEAEYEQRVASGRTLLQTALRYARHALASDNPKFVYDMALECQKLESDGRLLYFQHKKNNRTTARARQKEWRKPSKA